MIIMHNCSLLERSVIMYSWIIFIIKCKQHVNVAGWAELIFTALYAVGWLNL